MLEHLVDPVLYFESEAGSRYRIVRSTKNRFGAVNELGFFAMAESGLKEVRHPSAILLSRAPEAAPGSIVTVTREGGRPLLIELQALVDRMRFGAPRRIAQGLDSNRVAMLLAVMNRHAQVSLQEHDVFVNVVGGIQIGETGWDLPVVIALASSLSDRTVPNSLISFGEIGLTGEVRPVAYGEERLKGAQKQGMKLEIVAKEDSPRKPLKGVAVLHVRGSFEVGVLVRDGCWAAGELADDLFEDVLEGHYPFYIAVLVHHEGEAPAVALELRELHVERGLFRHKVRFAIAGNVDEAVTR